MKDKIKLTKTQGKLYEMLQDSDCLVDAGRRWGKTVVSQVISCGWATVGKNILVAEPNHSYIDIFIKGFKTMFSELISRIDYNHWIITLKNGGKIELIATDTVDEHNIFRDIEGVIIEEYGLVQNRLKFINFITLIPKNVRLCFVSTPMIDRITYAVRKYMYRSDSFHFFRFPTPEELLPEDIREFASQEVINQDYKAQIPVDPIADNVYFLERAILSLNKQVISLTTDLQTATEELQKIKEFTIW